MTAGTDMRDEDGRIVDGWIARMPHAAYLFHSDNSAMEAVAHAGTRYRADGHGAGSGKLIALFRYSFLGERHRPRRVGREEAMA